APMLRLTPGAPARTEGSLKASLRASGRWPRVGSEGQLKAQGLVADAWRLSNAQARWTLGTAADSRIDVQADLAAASHGVQRVERATLRVQGTPRAHQISFDAVSPVRPPGWADPVVGGAINGSTSGTL